MQKIIKETLRTRVGRRSHGVVGDEGSLTSTKLQACSEQTWDVAVKLCRHGRVDGRHFSVGVGLMAAEGSKADTAQRPR